MINLTALLHYAKIAILFFPKRSEIQKKTNKPETADLADRKKENKKQIKK